MGVKKYDYNENYFEKIDTPEKAYCLGFWYADGNVYNNKNNRAEITQEESKKDILEKIAREFGTDKPMYTSNKENGKTLYKLSFASIKITNDLIKLGCVPNKSLILQFPTFDTVPEKYMSHFIRGYFDGDGCIWNGKRKKMIVKDSTRKSGFRERIVHNVKFTFTGNVDFITALQDYLVSLEIVNKKTKLNFSKANNPNNNTCSRVCTMEYSGRKQIKNLYNYMYKDSTIHCDSKKLKFEEIFCASEEKSSEDTSLIAETPEMVISSEASIIEERSSTIPEMGVESSDSKCEAPNEKDEGEDIVSSVIK